MVVLCLCGCFESLWLFWVSVDVLNFFVVILFLSVLIMGLCGRYASLCGHFESLCGCFVSLCSHFVYLYRFRFVVILPIFSSFVFSQKSFCVYLIAKNKS